MMKFRNFLTVIKHQNRKIIDYSDTEFICIISIWQRLSHEIITSIVYFGVLDISKSLDKIGRLISPILNRYFMFVSSQNSKKCIKYGECKPCNCECEFPRGPAGEKGPPGCQGMDTLRRTQTNIEKSIF